MKKFASVLLAVLVAFSMFSFVVSAAAPSLTVSADKAAVKVGDTVKVTVKLAENSGLGALTYDITYDATAFKATNLTCDYAGLVIVNANFATGKARVTLTDAATIEVAVTATLTLEAIAAADSAKVGVEINEAVKPVEGNPTEVESVDVTTNSTSVKVEAAEAPTEKPTEHECEYSSWAKTQTVTCKKDGIESRTCKICGDTQTRVYENATGKCSYKWVVTKEATATQYGEKQFKCTMCGDVKETQKLAIKEDTITNPAIPNTDAIA